MFAITVNEKGGETRRLEFDKPEVTIGRVAGNDIILPKGNVSKRHSRIVFKDGKFIIVDLKSTNGTYVNGRKIASPLVIKSSDKVYIGDFILSVEDAVAQAEMPDVDAGIAPPLPPPARRPTTIPPPPPRRTTVPSVDDMSAEPRADELPAGADLDATGGAKPGFATAFDEMPPVESSPAFDEIPEARPAARPSTAAPRPSVPPIRPPVQSTMQAEAPVVPRAPLPILEPIDHSMSMGEPPPRSAAEPTGRPTLLGDAPPINVPLQRPQGPPTVRPAIPVRPVQAQAGFPSRERPAMAASEAARAAEAMRLLASRLAARVAGTTDLVEGERIARDLVEALAASGEVPPHLDLEALARDVAAEVLGWGPLGTLLEDQRVRQVVVSRYDRIFVDRDGQLALIDRAFSSPEAMSRVIERMAEQGRNGESHGALSGLVEARLPDGTLLLAALPPLAAPSPTALLRRPRREPMLLPDLVSQKVLSSAMAEVIELGVRARCNFLVAGMPGSGRSMLLAALANTAGAEERVAVVETREPLELRQEAAIQLSARGDAAEAIRTALRLGAERLLVDDVHGQEAKVALEAAAALPGAILSMAASSTGDALARFEAMVLLAGGNLDVRALRMAIAQSFQLVLQLERRPDGRARVTQLAEVTGVDSDGRLCLTDVFQFQPDGGEGRFAATGHVPVFAASASPSLFRL